MTSTSVFIVAAVVVTVLYSTSPIGAHFPKKKKNCWPNSTTVRECFASIKDVRLMRPTVVNDSYTVDNLEEPDLSEYTVRVFQRQPDIVCQNKDKMVDVLSCMKSAMATRCPDMPIDMLPNPDKLRASFYGYCSRTYEMNQPCIRRKQFMQKICKKKAYMQKPKDDGGVPEPEGNGRPKSKPESDWDDQTKLGPNQTDDPKPEREHNPEPESERDPDSEPESEPRRNMDRKKRDKRRCYFRFYKMMCFKKSLMSCHNGTADIISDFMKNMSTPKCSAMMDSWSSRMMQGDNCEEDYTCANGVTVLPKTWAALLIATLLGVNFFF